MLNTTEHSNGTSVTYRMPWGVYVSAMVLCPDGKVRKTKRIAQTADTFFSVPCSVRAYGKTVAGYLTTNYLNTDNNSTETVVRFIPYEYRKNHVVFTNSLSN